jgi:site-specific DNA-methyltransferase (adenine-specific)
MPYYADDWVTIYHGDCREFMPDCDIVLGDPPYGVGMEYGAFEDTPERVAELAAAMLPIFRQAGRVVALTPGIVNLSRWPDPDWCLAWVWEHTGSTGKWGFNQWGPILVWGTDPMLKAGRGRFPDVIRCQANEEPPPFGHPCPKPMRAWRRILLRLSLPGQTVVDPFMGSGTTLRAAKDLGRKAIGIELEERYCEVAANRCAQEVLDLRGVA